MSDAGGTTYHSHPPWKVEGATGTGHDILCSSLYLFLLLTLLLFHCLSIQYNSRQGWTGRNGQAAIETQDKMGGVNGYVSRYFLFSALFISSSRSLSFPLSTVQQQTGLGGM